VAAGSPPAADAVPGGAWLDAVPASRWDAGQAVVEMYRRHYGRLVREAALLVGDVSAAEDVVQDSFAALHRAWWRLREGEKALPYLRRSVVNRSRSVLRHRRVVDRHPLMAVAEVPSAEEGALTLVERSLVVSALRTLPPRQREAVVLRYYADMAEAEIAAAMGISSGAVKSHIFRAMVSLRAVLGTQLSPRVADHVLGIALAVVVQEPTPASMQSPSWFMTAQAIHSRVCETAAAAFIWLPPPGEAGHRGWGHQSPSAPADAPG
jgi:RNA polymerase sigma-70 factor (sigma-E family)